MSASASVQEIVAQQPRLARRRAFMRDFLIRTLGFNLIWNVTITVAENVPDTGPTVLMMNHVSLLDPIITMGAVTNRFVVPMGKAELMRNPLFAACVRWWGAYVVKRGEIDRKALTNTIELLKSGQLILMAPEGTRQRQGLAQPKEGLAYVATKADAIVVPTAVSGAPGWPKNLLRFRRTDIHIHFGRPFKFKTRPGERVGREALTAMMTEAMYQLSLALTDPALRGVYGDVSKATTDHLEFVNP